MLKIDKYDCKYLDGYKPCKYNKEKNISCSECEYYKPISMRILIIKIGAAGEVIRNTPILHKLREIYPDAKITWLTSFPELVPSNFVDRVLKYDWESLIYLTEEKFDLLLSLDKEKGSCAIANKIKANVKKGFCYSDMGKIMPIDSYAERKWRMGIDDVKMLKNTKHYVEEIFEICGYQWNGEKYILPQYKKSKLFNIDNIVVAINTGAGQVWKTRIPNVKKIEEIIHILIAKDYEVVLLGGPEENQKNIMLKDNYNLRYFGVNPLQSFINIMDNCDIIITSVTMALHIAIGLSKHVIVLNNIFNKNEFYLYERGIILEPDLNCLGCYKKYFDEKCPVNDCTLLYNSEKIVKYCESVAPLIKK